MLSGTDAVIKYTLGVPGSGKSLTRCIWIIEEFLEEHDGILYTNLSLNAEVIADYMEKRGFCREDIIGRIHVIPKSEIARWQIKDDKGMPPQNPAWTQEAEDDVLTRIANGEELGVSDLCPKYIGPWTYFADKDLIGAHIMIDEIQKIVDTSSSKGVKDLWSNYLSTIRHDQCCIEFMTQVESGIAPKIREKCESKLYLRPNGAQRLPLIPILNSDWYNLMKGLFDQDWKSTSVFEYSVGKGGRHEQMGSPKKYRLEPKWYPYYNTTSEAANKNKDGKKKKEPWQRYTKWGLVKWFYKRNSTPLFAVVAVLSLAVWFFGFQGYKQALALFNSRTQSNSLAAEAESKGMTLEEYKEELLLRKLEIRLKTQAQPVAAPAPQPSEGSTVVTKVSSSVVPVLKRDSKPAPEAPKPEPIKITFITKEYAILSNGSRLYEGDSFDGKKVSQVNFKRRRVEFDDDSILTF